MRTLLLFVFPFVLFASDWSRHQSGVAPVTNTLYKQECGACHFAYQSGLLPAKGWSKIMKELENHFGVDATLMKEDEISIAHYLNTNSAEKNMHFKRSRRIVQSLASNEVPKSITTTPYMIRKHDEIRPALITQKEVKGLFNCTACHTTANQGIYSERDINIPHFGRWDD